MIILLFASCYGNLDKLRLDGLLGSSRRNGNRRGLFFSTFPFTDLLFFYRVHLEQLVPKERKEAKERRYDHVTSPFLGV